MKAMDKKELVIDAKVLCPDCDESAELNVSVKTSRVQLTCPECGIVERGIVEYGGGLKVTEQ